MNEPGLTLRRAGPDDVHAITACVDAAYRHYVERIGARPGPMREDYSQVVARCQVTVAELGEALAGVIVLKDADEGFWIANVAVLPALQGQGIGRRLLEFAESEARRAGRADIHLFTNERMTENRALYARIGYVEYDLRREDGLVRVYLRKSLTSALASP